MPFLLDGSRYKFDGKLYVVVEPGILEVAKVEVNSGTQDPWDGKSQRQVIGCNQLRTQVYVKNNRDRIREKALQKRRVLINGKEKEISTEQIRSMKYRCMKKGLAFKLVYLDGAPAYSGPNGHLLRSVSGH